MAVQSTGAKFALAACLLSTSFVALAGPVRCSMGNEDSSCNGPIATSYQAAPSCPASEGYKTVTASSWAGAYWTTPTCSYTSPPSCPGGYVQTSAPTWDGSQWLGPGCLPSAPAVTPSDPVMICKDKAVAGGGMITSATVATSETSGSYWRVNLIPVTGPYYQDGGVTTNQYEVQCLIAQSSGTVQNFGFYPMSYGQPSTGGGG